MEYPFQKNPSMRVPHQHPPQNLSIAEINTQPTATYAQPKNFISSPIPFEASQTYGPENRSRAYPPSFIEPTQHQSSTRIELPGLQRRRANNHASEEIINASGLCDQRHVERRQHRLRRRYSARLRGRRNLHPLSKPLDNENPAVSEKIGSSNGQVYQHKFAAPTQSANPAMIGVPSSSTKPLLVGPIKDFFSKTCLLNSRSWHGKKRSCYIRLVSWKPNSAARSI
ncbi:hypothetical protein B0O99DRAFT_695648 [Bisporella sp. PMI_857]|nr:hypothetical protein B0O99DRAFT_695648 [Bisporella sp. PMI_857]